MIKLQERYNNSFKMTFDKVKKDNKVKVFQAPMGFGKTFNLITEWIPYSFNSDNIDYVILTAPKTDIVTDNIELLNDVVSCISGVVATTNVKEFMRRIKKGKKTVLYTTNQGFFVEKKGDELQSLLVGTKFAIFCDEFHTWSTSSKSNYRENLGHEASNFLAKMYTRLEFLAKHSSYLFAMTATPNWEVSGLLPTGGKLKYELANEDAKILPFELSNRSAWMGNRVFKLGKLELIEDTIKHSERQEELCGVKNVAIIICEQKGDGNFTPQDVLPILQDRITHGDIAISTHDEITIYTKDGNTYKVEDDDVLEKLNDFEDPLKYLLCVDKFAMGVNIVTAKTQCILKESNRTRKDGSAVIENALQVFGRLLRPNCGMPLSEFYNDYDGDLSKVEFEKEMNRMYFFCYDTPMWRAAMDDFENNIAPKMNIDLCPMCGAKLSKTAAAKFQKVENTLDAEFGIAS